MGNGMYRYGNTKYVDSGSEDEERDGKANLSVFVQSVCSAG